MPPESSSDVKFEIGHVLFIDIVGYSKLLINQQSEQLECRKYLRKRSRPRCFPGRAKRRHLACWLAIGLLCFPAACEAAFFERSAGQFLILTKEVSYRTDLSAGASLEQVLTSSGAWVSQADKPFP